MIKTITLGRWDVTLTNGSRWPLFSGSYRRFGAVRRRDMRRGFDVVWWRFRLSVEDHTVEAYETCSECGSPEVCEQRLSLDSDESLTCCPECGAVECGYTYLTKRQAEEKGII